MSKCISPHGEFSEHDLNESGWCEFCGVFDMAAHDAEVAAKTLEDAAAVVDSEERMAWSLDADRYPCAQPVAQRMQVVGRVLRARAAGIREEAK